MKEVESFIVPLVKTHFPAFYQEEGPNFVKFVEEYYKWMQTNGLTITTTTINVSNSSTNSDSVQVTSNTLASNLNTTQVSTISNTTATITTTTNIKDVAGKTIHHARNLSKYRDIDDTIDSFIVHFNNKYLNGLQYETAVSKTKLIKSSQDLFKSKGSEESIKLLFRLIFNKSVEIEYPGDKIIRPSDGTYVIPRYLEVTRTPRNVEYVGKDITGVRSGAKAFVEYLITRDVNGKLTDIFYLSNVRGIFQPDEILTDDGSVADACVTFGSLIDLDITVGGAGFEIGEEVTVVSSRGIEGRARVTDISTQTGLVTFDLVYGGWGYSTTANVIVSEKVLTLVEKNNSNSEITDFRLFEQVSQNLHSISLNDVTAAVRIGSIMTSDDGSNGVVVFAETDGNTATIRVNTLTGNVYTSNNFYDTTQRLIAVNTFIYSVNESLVQANSTNTTAVGTITSSTNTVTLTINAAAGISANGFHIGQFVRQSSTGANGTIAALDANSNFDYANVTHIVIKDINGTFGNTYTITAYSNTSNLTAVTVATPTLATNTALLLLTGIENDAWRDDLQVQGTLAVINSTPLVTAYVSGISNSVSNITATGNVVGSNATAVGLVDIENVFYGGNTLIRGIYSNTTAYAYDISTGTGANVSVGSIIDTETVRLNPDRISSNNFNGVLFTDIILSGANSGYTEIQDVAIISGGSGYDNTDIITYSGTPGSGGYLPANASIVTDNTGVITVVNIAANVGSNLISTPTISIVNSTGGSTTGASANLVATFSYGFIKLPSGDATFPELDLLRFEVKTIGTIATLTGINPGENYSAPPFVIPVEPLVFPYGKQDIILEMDVRNGQFIVNEYVEQTIETPGVKIISNNTSGNTSALYEVGEYVYSTDGINIIADGVVYSTTIDAGTNNQITIIVPKTNDFGTIPSFEEAFVDDPKTTILGTYLYVDNNTLFDPGETVRQGLPETANAIIISSNSSVIVVANINGSFVLSTPSDPTVNELYTLEGGGGGYALLQSFEGIAGGPGEEGIYRLFGNTTKNISDILSVEAYTASTLARGLVTARSNTNINVRRLGLFTTFVPTAANNLIGKTSGANSNITAVVSDYSSNVAGLNAIISANVAAFAGSITNTEVIDSGLGHIQDEVVTIRSLDGQRLATGKTNIGGVGTGTPYYATTKGFLSENKYLYDGDYYQEYSYVVNSDVSYNKYADMLKNVLHVAGTRFVGGIKFASASNVAVNIANSSLTLS